MENRRLLDRFEKANPRSAKRLRKKIKDDVDQRKFEEGKPLCFMLFHSYSVLLIPLDRYPDEFRHLYSDAIFDLDMKDDLERSNVINWCRTVRTLYPVKTTADGNCLANAVSQALWGIEDSEAFLRRLLYVTMTTDPRGRCKRRWLTQQRYATEEIGMGLRLNTDQYNNEWDAVIRATTDIGNVENQGIPYTFLESIHLYILANILRRPIILLADSRARNLLGESMQENDIGGIYLPLEWNHAECQKNPIVLGYNMNHFAPLIGQENANNDNTNKSYACPIVTHELQSLKLHFLLPGEESNAIQLLMRYLKIEEVVHTDKMSTILCARMTHCDLPDDMNMVQAHRKDCERKFRHQVDEEAGHRVQATQPAPRATVPQRPRATVPQPPRQTVTEPPRATVTPRSPKQTVVQPPRQTAVQPPRASEAPRPFEFQVLPLNNGNNVPPNANINTVRPEQKPGTVKVVQQPRQPVPSGSEKRKRCSVVGCKMYGSTEFHGLCSKCFNDFTIQYAQGEANSRQRRDPVQNILPQTMEPAPMYNDLSIMGENCQTGCGFRCSTETFPYCHECYPKVTNQTAALVARPIAEDIQLSVMPERCQEPNCTYRASTNTFPYCHQCYEKHVPKAEPSAPPVSVPVEIEEPSAQVNDTGDEILQLRIQEEPETNLIEIRQPPDPRSLPGFSHAVTGAQHMPMDILPAVGSGVLNRKCKKGGCLNNAIRGNDGFCDQCYDQSLFGAGDFEGQGNVVPNVKRQTICRSANCNEAVASGCDFCLECFLKDGTLPSTSGRELKEMQVGNQQSEFRNIQVPQRSAAFTVAAFAPLPQATNQESTSKETHRKYICAKAGCEGIRIDSNTGLCYDCSKVANQTKVNPQQSNDLNRKSNLEESAPYVSSTPCNLSEEEKKELFPIVTSSKQKVKCAAAICNNMIYPPSKLCENCTIAIQKSFAEKLKSGEHMHTAPIASNRNGEHTANHQRHTVPIAKLHAKLCIEKDCERYGDPAQKDRCSRHYNLAMQRFQQPSPPLGQRQMTKQLNGEVTRPMNRNILLNVPVAQSPVPVENGDQLTAVMNRIENTRKSRSKCKNNTRTGCVNYGNTRKGGFCNQCFNTYSAQTLVGHTPLPGLNQFD